MPVALFALVDQLVEQLASLEPREWSVDECVAVVERLAKLEKASAAARATTAARVAECGGHRKEGFLNPADWLARATGTSAHEAARELATVEQLDALPRTREALVSGELSMAQAHEVAITVEACPEAEPEMLAAAGVDGLRALRQIDKTKRLRAIDPEDLDARQRSVRSYRQWYDEVGLLRFSGALVPTVGVPFARRIDLETDRHYRKARREGRRETREQLAADAFADVVAGQGKSHAVRADVVYVCNIETGECHIVGGGPVPRSAVDIAAKDAFIKAVLHDGTKVDTIVHYGRKAPPALLRSVLELGAPPAFDGIRCVDCGRGLGLQWDHVDPVANNGPTRFDNLEPRCWDCHHEKTERDRRDGLLGPHSTSPHPSRPPP